MQPRERVDVLFSLRGESLIKKTCDLQQLLTAPAEKRLIVVIRQELDSISSIKSIMNVIYDQITQRLLTVPCCE